MGSAEIVDSGRFSGGRSNFSQMCTLLSQYLKEKGSFGDLKLGLTNTFDPKGSPTETMNLLPKIEKPESGPDSGPSKMKMLPTLFAAGRDETQNKPDLSGAKTEAETAQMTIFYGGQVIVFDDLPADKATQIMMLATKSSAAGNRPNASFLQSTAESATGVVPTNLGIQERRPQYSAQPPLHSDLPIARKNSLARFLEKRKDRIVGNAPYPVSKPRNEAWLGLAPEIPLQIERH